LIPESPIQPMPDHISILNLQDVSVVRQGRAILDHVNLELHEQEITTLIGPNGSGKTTLIRLILGLIKPTTGEVKWREKPSVGYMPQKLHIEPTLPLTVERFLLMAQGTKRSEIDRVLNDTGILHLRHSPIQHVSGGEFQRVLLSRAILRRPQLLVLDEPVQGVDVSGQLELYQLITYIKEQYGCTVLMVSHDLHLVMAKTDHVICLNQHICCQGSPQIVSHDPEFTALFGEGYQEDIALYNHQHDHHHHLDGKISSPRFPRLPSDTNG
jgi:zinc transport system ATP-binding protein